MLVLGGVGLFISRARFGKAMRAVSDNGLAGLVVGHRHRPGRAVGLDLRLGPRRPRRHPLLDQRPGVVPGGPDPPAPDVRRHHPRAASAPRTAPPSAASCWACSSSCRRCGHADVAQERRARSFVLDRRPAVPPAGHLRPTGAGGLGELVAHQRDDVLRRSSASRRSCFVLAAMGLNFHYGYTGLMNFGQAAFLAAGAYGVAITFETFGWSMWVGILRRHRVGDAAGAPARHPDAATAGRLPGHRHHRGVGDHPARRPLRGARGRDRRQLRASTGSPAPSTT